jgi:putative nucleotidyltransferase with HDIG domain
MKDVTKLLRSIKQLKPFPTVVQKALAMLDDPNVSIQELVDTIKFDPGITANILKMCNSPLLGLRQQVHSLNQAMLYLGTQKLLQIVIASGATPQLAVARPGYGLDKGGLWRHSIGTAIMASLLVRQLGLPGESTFFTAALLHDIGKIVLDQYVREAFKQIIALVEKQGYAFQEAERTVIGMDHAAVGGEIATLWNFPEIIRSAIVYHHMESPEVPKNDVVMLVHLADLLVIMMGTDLGADGLAYRGNPGVMKHFNLRHRHIEQVLAMFWLEIQQAQDLFSLDSK